MCIMGTDKDKEPVITEHHSQYVYIQHFLSQNDANGNARRLYLIYNKFGTVVACWDEASRGAPKIVLTPQGAFRPIYHGDKDKLNPGEQIVHPSYKSTYEQPAIAVDDSFVYLVELMPVNISPAEYREIRKQFKERSV